MERARARGSRSQLKSHNLSDTFNRLLRARPRCRYPPATPSRRETKFRRLRLGAQNRRPSEVETREVARRPQTVLLTCRNRVDILNRGNDRGWR